ncbi:hypothetical protein I548_2136 [Mycobacterium intracellulare]|nr:hypothetical protein I548_2136 [Mycobacterium intracellulare]
MGLVAFTAAFVAGSEALSGFHATPPKWASWVRLVFGVALLALAAFHWFTRHRNRSMPRWMRSFSTLSPARAGVVGAVLVPLRPEVLILCAAAGLAVGNSSLSAGGELVAAAIFVVVAASTVAIPILAYAGSGDRFEGTLERLKAWMEANHDAMLAVILFLIGLIVLYNGIRALA